VSNLCTYQLRAGQLRAGRSRDRDILDLIGRTTVDVVDEFAKATQRRNCRITATLKSGGTAAAHRVVTLADIEHCMCDDRAVARIRCLHHRRVRGRARPRRSRRGRGARTNVR
jgi:hypothetical protein